MPGLAEKNKARQEWLWARNRLNKPPLLWDYKAKAYRRIPYENMHQGSNGKWYVDVKLPVNLDIVSLAMNNPRYFDRVDTPKYYILRKRRKTWLHAKTESIFGGAWQAVLINLTAAMANIGMAFYSYLHR